MSVYVGIDVHRKRSQVAIIDQGRKVAVAWNVPNGVESVVSVIGSLPARTPVAFEAEPTREPAGPRIKRARTGNPPCGRTSAPARTESAMTSIEHTRPQQSSTAVISAVSAELQADPSLGQPYDAIAATVAVAISELTGSVTAESMPQMAATLARARLSECAPARGSGPGQANLPTGPVIASRHHSGNM